MSRTVAPRRAVNFVLGEMHIGYWISTMIPRIMSSAPVERHAMTKEWAGSHCCKEPDGSRLMYDLVQLLHGVISLLKLTLVPLVMHT